jgi:hypothetical protein
MPSASNMSNEEDVSSKTVDYSSPFGKADRSSKLLISTMAAGILSAAIGLILAADSIRYSIHPHHFPPATLWFPSTSEFLFGILILLLNVGGGLWAIFGGLAIHLHPKSTSEMFRKAKLGAFLGLIGLVLFVIQILVDLS